MSIKKRITALVLSAVFTLPFISGCHGAKETNVFEIPESFDTEKKTEITFWAKNDTNKVQTAVYRDAISGFRSIYPNVTVNLKLYTDYGSIYNDVITNIPTKTTPNVCITYPDHIATYMTGENVVVPLDELFDDEKYGFGGSDVKFDAPKKDEIVEKFLDECIVNGGHYAVPFMRSSEALYINKTYVEAMGYAIPDNPTWDFVWEVSEAAMKKDENDNYAINGQRIMIPFIYKSTDNMMIQMLKQRGAGYSDENGSVLIFNDTVKEFLYTISEHVASGAFSTFKISSYPGNFFNAGRCIFAIDSTAGSTWIGAEAPLQDIHEKDVVQFETIVRPIPQYDTEKPQMISQGPSVCIFNKEDTQEVLASWLFVQYLLTNDIQIPYSKTEGYVPVTKKAQKSPEYTDYLNRSGEDNDEHYNVKIDTVKMVLDNIGNTFITPVFNGSTSLRDAAGQLIESTAKSTRRKEEIDEAYIEKLYKDVNSLYRLDQIEVNSSGKKKLGDLPTESVVLLCSLGGVWAVIIAYIIFRKLKKK